MAGLPMRMQNYKVYEFWTLADGFLFHTHGDFTTTGY